MKAESAKLPTRILVEANASTLRNLWSRGAAGRSDESGVLPEYRVRAPFDALQIPCRSRYMLSYRIVTGFTKNPYPGAVLQLYAVMDEVRFQMGYAGATDRVEEESSEDPSEIQ